MWDKRIEKAETYLQKTHEHGRKVYQRYEDTRDELEALGVRANFFYANVNTLKESLFNSMPKPDVKRVQQGDFQDEPSRVAAAVVQRGLTYEIECAVDFDEAISNAILDRLVPGLGQVWVSFGVDKNEQGQPQLGSESIMVEHVYWEDFLYEPCRRWSKCGWVGRRLHLSKNEFVEDYGEEAYRLANDMRKPEDDLTPKEINVDKLCVYEIWSKRDKKVYHVFKGMEKPLKEMDDPYKLKGFFPCPKPLMANVTTVAFKPRTDYSIAQDQYNQLDVLYARISLIIKALKVAGLYDASNTAVGRMLQSPENTLVPVDNWAMHAEKGGTQGMIDWYPVEQVATVLEHLYKAFEGTKQILFEVTGMSDIIRGASNPYETKGAQEIKAQFASVRMGGYQRDVAKFVRGVLRIMAEMFTQLYSDEKILTIIGQLPPNDMKVLPQAAQVLRSDVLSKYKVNIQTHSLTQADWALEKEQRMDVITTIGQMLSQIAELAQSGIPQIPMLGVQLIKFAISGYKAGTELEGWIDGILDEMATQANEEKQNPKEEEPSPEEKKIQMEMEAKQQEMGMKQQEMDAKMQMEQQKMQLEAQAQEAEFAHKQRMADLEFQIKMIELQMKQQEAGLNLQIKQAEATMDMEVQQQKSALDMETAEQKSAMSLEQNQQNHEQKMQQSAEAAKQKAKQQPKGDKE